MALSANPPLCRTTSEAAEKVASHVACALVGMYTLMMHGGIERKRKRMRDCEHSIAGSIHHDPIRLARDVAPPFRHVARVMNVSGLLGDTHRISR